MDAVYDLHATGKGEALYVVGPEHAYVIEANAREAAVEEIDDVYVRTNYAVKLYSPVKLAEQLSELGSKSMGPNILLPKFGRYPLNDFLKKIKSLKNTGVPI